MKVLFWLLFAVGCVYVFYTGATAVWSYLETTGVVEEVVVERAPRIGGADRAARLKDEIAKKLAASGIRIDERDLSVSDEGRTLDISVRWNWPVIVYQGHEYLSVPLKHERSFNIPERR